MADKTSNGAVGTIVTARTNTAGAIENASETVRKASTGAGERITGAGETVAKKMNAAANAVRPKEGSSRMLRRRYILMLLLAAVGVGVLTAMYIRNRESNELDDEPLI
jgi:hypothetical protein